MLKKFFGDHFDALTLTAKVSDALPSALPKDLVRRKALDVLLTVGIPFNRWLGLTVKEISTERVVIESPPRTLRRNHVGTAHACAQALIGEFAAGLIVAQHFPLETYRFIIGKLEIEYFKAGRGTLYGVSEAPVPFPELVDEEGWVPMKTVISNSKGEEIAVCTTRWQVKSWRKIAADRVARGADGAAGSPGDASAGTGSAGGAGARAAGGAEPHGGVVSADGAGDSRA